ncbi:MAG: hypothetical protein HRT71_21465 [Flavobacteriales bacterium]|nr:hypothetical protein [Flavobacteriales bacterium]
MLVNDSLGRELRYEIKSLGSLPFSSVFATIRNSIGKIDRILLLLSGGEEKRLIEQANKEEKIEAKDNKKDVAKGDVAQKEKADKNGASKPPTKVK